MQELSRADRHAGPDLLGLDGFAAGHLAAAGCPETLSVCRQLDEARVLAGNGEPRTARVLCAEIVFEHLPRLARDHHLLRLAIATLIHARGFQLLGRLLVAVDGHSIRVLPGEPPAGGAAPPHLVGRAEQRGVTTFTVSERLYGDPSRDAVIDRLSEEVARRREPAAAAR